MSDTDRPGITHSINATARTIALAAREDGARLPERDTPQPAGEESVPRGVRLLTDLFAYIKELTDTIADRDHELRGAVQRADRAEREAAGVSATVMRVERSRKSLAEANAEIKFQLAAARDELQRLQDEVGLLREELEFARRQARLPPPPYASESARRPAAGLPPREAAFDAEAATLGSEDPSEGTADPIVAAFLDWCHQGGGLVGEMDRFAPALRARCPGATVRRVHRDSDSPALPVRLTEMRGLSPIEYWVTSHLGRTVVLPQPLNPSQFRELAPCFEGTAAPRTLAGLVPPAVREDGGGLRVEAAGHVE